MAILSLVFCSYFTKTGWFLCDLGEGITIDGISDCWIYIILKILIYNLIISIKILIIKIFY